ncbi:MAG: hypothetical protein OXH52_02715 [Gammaproteobacteria bacterium]|nr:hypothetical protein [Gammaproteobacteria bacterium]
MAVFRAFQSSLRSRRRLVPYVPPILVLLAVVGLMLFIDSPRDEVAVEQDLCPTRADDIAELAVFLLDLRKPLGAEHVSLPGDLLREIAMDLDANAELQVFALAGTAAAPRIALDSTCKPYDNAELAVGTGLPRDCDDLPTSLPVSVRDEAGRFCAWRDALRSRLEGLVVRQRETAVANAYLVEAIEDTIFEFAEFSGRRSLYIFSDMMQHAPWYSQPESGVEYGDSGGPRDAHDSVVPLPRAVDDLGVKIYYVPRQGVTEDPVTRSDHKNFWREYFADFSGSDIVFEDQPVMTAYEVESLASEPTEIELAAREREQLRLEREQIELALAEVEKERAALETARRLAADERQAREAREAELREQQELARTREAEREAEQRRLEAEQRRLEAERAEIARRVAGRPPQDAIRQEPVAESNQSRPAAVELPVIAAPAADAAEVVRIAPEQAAPGGSEEQPQTGDAPCPAQLKTEFAAGGDFYPGDRRVNYGGAVITVRYALNAEGETLDDETAVVDDSSNAARPRFLDSLARDTVELVRGWEFAFTREDGCVKPQVQTAVFRYRSKCVGAPVPACRTIQSDVTLLTTGR